MTKLPDDNYYTALKNKNWPPANADIILAQPKYAGSNAVYAFKGCGYLAELDGMSCLEKSGDLIENMTYNGKYLCCFRPGVSILGTTITKIW